MAGKVLNKMMGLFGMDEELEEIEEVEEELEQEVEEPFVSNTKKPNKVVNIHTAASTKIMIIKPEDYEEATTICDNLKNRKIIVVNITHLDPKTGQRLLDFMGGASYALGGELQQVEKGVYVLSPSNVEIDSELKDELSNKGIFGWGR